MSNGTTGPGQVLIIRHGEKPGDPGLDSDADGPDLSPEGYKRAAALSVHIPASFPKPDVLIATQPSRHSNRPLQTITPLAEKLKLDVNSKHPDDDYGTVAQRIRNNPKYAGKNVLICWHHGKIPQLAAALGVVNPPSPWPGQVFDRVWQIDFAGGVATLKDVPQRLMYGDSSS